MTLQRFLKVVSAQEMARIEKWAIEKGASEEAFVEAAGKKVAEAVIEFIEKRRLGKKVAMVIGKGNKGADAYAAGRFLLEEGFHVRAIPLCDAEDCSGLNRKMGDRFRKRLGHFDEGLKFQDDALILDGLLGTGFKGKIEGILEKAICKMNDSGKPIISIDIPSGLNGSTGEIGGSAIHAQETVALGLPKIGFFLRDGWNCVGQVRVEDFGLSEEAIDQAQELAYFPLPSSLRLPPVMRTRHKYQAGYVLGIGGSKELTGAPKLTGLAALRAGAGIVRIFSRDAIGPCPLELICSKWNEKQWREEMKRAGAVFIGPGLGKAAAVKQWVKKELKKITIPSVIDADALLPDLEYPKNAILTPHRGEALRLLGLKEMPLEELLFSKIMKFCERKRVIILLKGAPTFIFIPEKPPLISPFGDPGMASAGTGDVLTGILAALLAQKMEPEEAAVLGAALHGIAGEIAAHHKTSYGLIASDLIDFLPQAFRTLIE